MRILIVCHYFPPEVGAPQARVSELARFWTEAGDDVTVLTGMPNHPTGIVPDAYRGKLRLVERADGYRVVRTWLYATPNEGVLKKTLGHVSFMLSSILLGVGPTGSADVVLVSSPTFFSIFSAWLLARIKRARFVIEVRDLWPAIFVELGVLKNRHLVRVLESLELSAYRGAEAVVTVSEGFRTNIIGRQIPSSKVHTIRNGVALDRFDDISAADRDHARAELGAKEGDTLVLYLGAHGISHGLTSVADAAARLRSAPIHFTFVGDGAAKGALLERIKDLGLSNTTSLPSVPSERVPTVLAAADVCLVPLRDVELFNTFIPSKMFEYFAAGKPVVAALRGEAADILRAAGAIVVEPEDSGAISAAVEFLAQHPDTRRQMGSQARRYVEAHYDRRVLAARYRDILEGVLDSQPSPAARR
jgi:glycosyltransferase involved in cell wall biosynthesis